MTSSPSTPPLCIGWAQADITPVELPVYIAGQFHIRVSEGIHDPLSATALVLESGGAHAVFVSVDTVIITDDLHAAVLERLNEDGLDPQAVVLHATHTHEAPNNGVTYAVVGGIFDAAEQGVDPGFKPAADYVNFAAGRIAGAISEAWQKRAPGGVAYGQDYAVIGRNRRWVDRDGVATTYGLDETTADRFDHIEGYEDHSVNILTTYNAEGTLTGLILNIACPSQESENIYEVSADFWDEVRKELRARYGDGLFILPQCSAAGELTSHLIYDNAAFDRMLKLRGRNPRQEVALRIAETVERVLPWLEPAIDYAPLLKHEYQTLQLPLYALSEADVEAARLEIEKWDTAYRDERRRFLDDPALMNEPRWHDSMTWAFNRAGWNRGVVERYEKSKEVSYYPARVHILRLGEIVFATNPFEYYLDFGIQIKVKSKALQTFIVQLAGAGTYLPGHRAAAGGAYGAVPASCPVGPEGGQLLADFTVNKIKELWPEA